MVLGGLGDIATQSGGAAPNVFDTINNVLTKVVQPAANIYTQVKTNTPASPNIPQTNQTQPVLLPAALQPEPVDNTKKYLLIGGGVLVVGTGLYFLTRKKGGKK